MQSLEAQPGPPIPGRFAIPRPVDSGHQHLAGEDEAGQGQGGERRGPGQSPSDLLLTLTALALSAAPPTRVIPA